MIDRPLFTSYSSPPENTQSYVQTDIFISIRACSRISRNTAGIILSLSGLGMNTKPYSKSTECLGEFFTVERVFLDKIYQ